MSHDASATVPITNRRGLHARAAAKFVGVAAGFNAQITVERAGTVVSGCSILGLMMLGAGLGSEIVIRATGQEAAQAVKALRALVEAKFDEE
jgi:phosphocarrier protein